MVGLLSDVGRVRKLNEDFADFYKSEGLGIYVIADGMGGHNAGEVASKIAVETTISYIKSKEEIDMKGDLLNAINLANDKIYKLSRTNKKFGGMGTTITACLVKSGEMVVANVGYSGITKITKDHSLVQQLVDEGSITEEEAAIHPNKNIITRAIGTNISVEVDIFKVNLQEVRKVILCTDGLSNGVSMNEMYDIIVKNDNENSCRQLIELSNLRGGRDNISVIVFEGECKDDRDCAGK